MPRLPGRHWSFLGCVSHEERSLAALNSLGFAGVTPTLVRIFDEDPVDEAAERYGLDLHRASAIAAGVAKDRFVDAPLLATVDQIERIVLTAIGASRAVVVDISSFPKRWFFVIARLVHENRGLDDVVFTYALGTKYADVLSSNPEIVRTIPTFTSIERRTSCDVAFVGIGYHSSSVLDLFDIERPKAISMLFPFPPGPPGIARNWKFVERIERSIRSSGDDPDGLALSGIGHLHIGALDLPQNFHALKMATDGGKRTSLVAPYGPKPVSLAMCLYALAAEVGGMPEVPAYYSQPMRYALDYTTGVQKQHNHPLVYGYPTRLKSANLYRL
jgi:hypothetical protein